MSFHGSKHNTTMYNGKKQRSGRTYLKNVGLWLCDIISDYLGECLENTLKEEKRKSTIWYEDYGIFSLNLCNDSQERAPDKLIFSF